MQDNTKLSKINGYGSIGSFLAKTTPFKIIQPNKNIINIRINPQLPAI